MMHMLLPVHVDAETFDKRGGCSDLASSGLRCGSGDSRWHDDLRQAEADRNRASVMDSAVPLPQVDMSDPKRATAAEASQ